VKRKKTLQYSTQNPRQNGCNSPHAQTDPSVLALVPKPDQPKKGYKKNTTVEKRGIRNQFDGSIE
jgi:hypothetical protein